jgi:tRNA A-37 threonylcarbamoyl transferase component Bud32
MSETWNAEALIGTQLGECVIERPLAVGGMGAVYVAQQRQPRRRVAVKVLRASLAPTPETERLFLARFRHEADATAALDHANIVPVYAFGQEHGVAYLVMPYLPDGSLGDLLVRQGPLRLDQAVRFVEQAAAALDYAHAQGVVHRDVKPSNLLVHADGRVLLSDFGIARATEPLEQAGIAHATADRQLIAAGADAALSEAGVVAGTPAYMAPEQALDEPVSAATDIYALGTVAFTLLAGRPPFGGGDSAAVLRRKLTEPPAVLRGLRPDVPPGVERAITWAMARDPTARPASAGEFARALGEASGTGGGQYAGLLGDLTVAAGRGAGRWDGAPSTDDPGAALGVALGAANAPTEHIRGLQPPAGGAIWPVAEAAAGGTRWGGVGVALTAGAGAVVALLIAVALAFSAALLSGGPQTRGGLGGAPSAPQSPLSTATALANALTFSPTPLVLTSGNGDHHACTATQTIANTTQQTVGWSWQQPAVGGMQFQVNGGDSMDWPQDTSPGIPPSGSDTLTVSADCRGQAPQSVPIVVQDTLGQQYTFVVQLQNGGGGGGGG